MSKINIYIKNSIYLNETINNNLNIFNNKIANYSNFSVTNYINLSDIIVVYIYELSELIDITTLPTVIFIFFNPCESETKIINESLLNKTIVAIYSPYNIKNLKNLIIFKFPIKKQEVKFPKNKKIYRIKIPNDIINNILPPHLIKNEKEYEIFDTKYLLPNIFDFTIVEELNKGKLVISNGELYPDEIITDLSLENISKKRVYDDGWKFLDSFYEVLRDYLYESRTNLIKLPFLDLTSDTINILDTASLNEIITKNTSLCYNTKGELKDFLPWALTISHSNLESGLILNRNQLINTFPHFKIKKNYYTLSFIDCGLSHSNDCSDYILDQENNNYGGILPITKWTICEKITYIKKPNTNIDNTGIIMFIENSDDFRNMVENIGKLKEFPIEIYYIDDLYDIPQLPNFNNIKIIPIKKEKLITDNFLLEKLNALLLSQFSKILFIADNTRIINAPKNINLERDLFFSTLIDPRQIDNYSFILKEFPIISKDLDKIDPDIFFIDKIDWWFDILSALGLINHYKLVKNNLEILYLARLLNGRDINVYKDNMINCQGYKGDQLFYGYPITEVNDLKFTRVPYWYYDKPYTHKVDDIESKTWCFNPNFKAIVTNEKEAKII